MRYKILIGQVTIVDFCAAYLHRLDCIMSLLNSVYLDVLRGVRQQQLIDDLNLVARNTY